MKKNQEHSLIPVIAVVGPTASGKTHLAIHIAQKFHGEVVSADSRQVYKGLNIGTGKVTRKEMLGVPHYLLDVTSPKCQISVEVWKKKAEKIVEEIHKKGRLPILCGGTGLYIDTLLRGMSFPEVPPNPLLRRELEKKSIGELSRILKKQDPRRWKTIDQKNPRRLIRAIEIAKMIGAVPPLSKRAPPYGVLWIGINPPDELLRKNIRSRLHQRMRMGMVREAQELHRRGLSWKRMRELGLEYRFLADFLQEKISKKIMLEKLEIAIWQYAKRQRIWFKRNKEIYWYASGSVPEVFSTIGNFTKKRNSPPGTGGER